MKKRVAISICLLLYAFSHSQETRSFTFEEAIEFALENNYEAINTRREMAKALKKKWETIAAGLPQVNASVAYQNQLKQPISLIPGEFSGGAPGTFTPVTFVTKQVLSGTITLSQLIFDGSYLVAIEAAKTYVRFTENSKEKALLEVRKGIINAYGSVLVARESVAIIEKNKDNLENALKELNAIYKNGLAEEESVEQMQLTLLQLESQLENTKRLATIAEQMLNLALGISIKEKVILQDTLETLTTRSIDPKLTDEAQKIENNIDFKIITNLVEQRMLELKLEKSKALPSLGAFLNYGTTANSNTFTFLDGDQAWFQSSILGVNLSIPIFSSFGRDAKTKQAEIALEQAETQRTQAEEQIRLQIETARSNYQFAIANYETLQKNVALAMRIEEKNQVKFTEGIASSFDLRQAQLQLYSSQQDLLTAMQSIIVKKADLEILLNSPKN